MGQNENGDVNMEKMLVHYVEFFYHGTIVPNSEIVKIKSRNLKDIHIPEQAFAFKLMDRTEMEVGGEKLVSEEYKNKTGLIYIEGKILKFDDIPKTEEFRRLRSNMKDNRWNRVIKCGDRYYPFEESDKKLIRYKID